MTFIFFHARVPGEIKRREVELDPQLSPEEIVSREVELGCESCSSVSSSTMDIVLVAAQHGGGPRSFSGSIHGQAFTLSPSSPLSPSLISNVASVDVKQNGPEGEVQVFFMTQLGAPH